MKPYANILTWIAAGIVLGLLLFLLLSPPGPAQPLSNKTNTTQPPLNNTQPPANITPPANTTPPAPKKNVDVYLITTPDCSRCDEIGYLLFNQTRDEITQSSGGQVGSSFVFNPSTADAQSLISKYNITALPAVLVSDQSGFTSNDVNTWKNQIGTIEPDGFFVQRFVYPPYYDLANRSYAGFVRSIAISASGCDECMNASLFANSLENSSAVRMVFSNSTVLDENSTEARELIAKYNITELPALFLSLDAAAYPVYQQIKPLGEERDGWFILRDVHPPYVDLQRNHSVRGLVSLIQIVNSSCSDCFSADTLSDYIANNAGIDLVNKTTYELNSTEGQALVKRYNLTFVPTVLFSPELSVYPRFYSIWTSQNNTVESDGWFVFRAYAVIKQPYQNLTAAQNST